MDAAARVLPEMIFVHALAAGLDAGTATAQVDRLRLSRRPAIVYLVPSYLPERMTQGMRPRVDAHPDAETIRARVAETLPPLAALTARAATAYVRLRYATAAEASAPAALRELEDCTRVLLRWRAPNRR